MEFLETHQFRQIRHIPDTLEQPFRNDEPPRKRLLALLLDSSLQHPLQIRHIIMLVPSHRAPTNLNALPDGKVDRLVRNNDIAPLAEARNDAGDGREGLRVDDAGRHAEVGRDVRLRLLVHVLGAVETWRAAGADAICAEGLDSLFFEDLGGEEVVEVVGCQVRHGAAVGELRFGSRRSAKQSISKPKAKRSQTYSYPTITGRFSLSCSSNGVVGATSGSGVHSSTSSSISYFLSAMPTHTPRAHWTTTNRISKLDLLLRAILGRKQVPHSEKK